MKRKITDYDGRDCWLKICTSVDDIFGLNGCSLYGVDGICVGYDKCPHYEPKDAQFHRRECGTTKNTNKEQKK